jgi:hypothetical protein
MARRLALVLTLSLFASKSFDVGAADAPPSCPEEIGQPIATKGIAYASRGSYCDGEVFEPNAGSGELALIGLSVGLVRGDPSQHQMRIGLLPAPTTSGAVRIRGVARRPRTNYRLDATLKPPVSALVVGPESAMSSFTPPLLLEQVAWAAWNDTKKGRTYIPVQGMSEVDGVVRVVVRPTFHTAFVSYELRTEGDQTLIPENQVAGNAVLGGPITIEIPPGDPTIVVLDVTAQGNAGETQVASIRFIRPRAAIR